MSKGNHIEELRAAMLRSNTRLLLSSVMLFQALSMLLLAFKTQPVNPQALFFAAALPAGPAPTTATSATSTTRPGEAA